MGGLNANLVSIQDELESTRIEAANRLITKPMKNFENLEKFSKIETEVTSKPPQICHSKSPMARVKFVFFDLETTGIKRDAAIVELAAWAQDATDLSLPEKYDPKMRSCDVFHAFMMPDKRMNPGASKVNGIKRKGPRKLLVRGRVIEILLIGTQI